MTIRYAINVIIPREILEIWVLLKLMLCKINKQTEYGKKIYNLEESICKANYLSWTAIQRTQNPKTDDEKEQSSFWKMTANTESYNKSRFR